MTAPKLFMSYSWSNQTHQQWVIDLATDLRESGIDVILDKWDLKEGHDAISFMEKMVTDPEIKKVAIVSDQTYAAKANSRAGGVGTETQIISKEVYDNQSQEKFVVIVSEKDDEGKPFLPTYYNSRLYIDLSEEDRYSENFDQLLRWVFDKPLYQKPPLGEKPAFLSDDKHISLGTTPAFKRCIDAIKNNKPFASGALDEYCELFVQNFERFRIQTIDGRNFDDDLIKNIEDFLPYRNEAIQLFITVAQYAPAEEIIERIHRFFESLIPYMQKPGHIQQYHTWDFDNFKFLMHELFLYTVAALLKKDRLELAADFLSRQYYLPDNWNDSQSPMARYWVFYEPLESLEHRNKRLNLRRYSLRSDLLKERSTGTGIEFRHLMQADFIAFLRSEIESNGGWRKWWPETLCYSKDIGNFYVTFEIFARSASKAYFDRAKRLIAIQSPSDLAPLFEQYKNNHHGLPSWGFNRLDPATLIDFKHLATRA